MRGGKLATGEARALWCNWLEGERKKNRQDWGMRQREGLAFLGFRLPGPLPRPQSTGC